jgi:3-oxoacyl-[acyl-carrier-protein] synthase II
MRENIMMNKVVVTGVGLVTPLGVGREKTWQRLVSGESAVCRDPKNPSIVSARIDCIEQQKETRLLAMGFLAAAEAIHDAKIDCTQIDRARFGNIVSTSKPNLHFMNPSCARLEGFLPSSLGEQLSRIFKLRGPCRNIAAACATGTDAIAIGAHWIRSGECDIVIAGAAESSFHELYEAGFMQMGVLARNRVAPFDTHREGFAMGEGAGVVVLESYEHAALRGVHPYGEIAGSILCNDAFHPVSFRRDGAVIARAVQTAMKTSGCSRVDYINAHGTGTALNDVIETRALKMAYGDTAKSIPVSSTKAATGHLLGATGAVEFGFCLLAMRDNIIPPTLNLTTPDPQCDLDYVPIQARRQYVRSALSLSFGFGGQIGVLITRKI